MRALAVVLIVMPLLAACAETGKVSTSGEVLSLAPVVSEVMAADYQRLAECTYLKLQEPGVHKADFPTQRMTKVSLDAGSARHWEISFNGTEAKRTRVDIAVVVSIWGPVAYRKLLPVVQSCGVL